MGVMQGYSRALGGVGAAFGDIRDVCVGSFRVLNIPPITSKLKSITKHANLVKISFEVKLSLPYLSLRN